jgi:hypothetical protein
MKKFYWHKALCEGVWARSLTGAYVHFRVKFPRIPGMTPADFIIAPKCVNITKVVRGD